MLDWSRIGCQLQDLDVCHIAPPHRRGAPNSHRPQKPKIPENNKRRSSRAGMLHFPMVLLLLDPKHPPNSPACFASASFPYRFTAFGPQIPSKTPWRASRAGLLHSPIVSCCLWKGGTKNVRFPIGFPMYSLCSSYRFPIHSLRISYVFPM